MTPTQTAETCRALLIRPDGRPLGRCARPIKRASDGECVSPRCLHDRESHATFNPGGPDEYQLCTDCEEYHDFLGPWVHVDRSITGHEATPE